MTRPEWAPEDVDTDLPSAARMYDYNLGGVHNFAADRELTGLTARSAPTRPSHLAGIVRFVR